MIRFLVILLIISYSFGNYDNIYNLISSPRNISIGEIHASTGNIDSMFDTPLILENSNNIFLSINKYSDLYSVYHLSYCVYANSKSNLLFGLVRREIKDNFNTESAWNNNGYPNLEDIDYNQIYNFSDKETGLLIAYNKLIKNNFIMGINFKPIFHRIDNISGVGFSLDIRYLIIMKKIEVSFGVNDLLAFKKWDTHLLEKYDLNGYFGTSLDISNNNTLFYEYSIGYGSSLGFETKLIDILHLRLGYNKNNNFTFGFGIQLENMNLDYGYINNNSIAFGDNHIIGFNINLNN